MKRFKKTNLLVLILTIATIFACDRQEEIQEDSSEVLENKILTSNEVINFNGNLHGGYLVTDEMAVDRIYENGVEQGAIITIPINTKSTESKGLFAYYDSETESLDFQVIGIKYSNSFIQKARELNYTFDTSKSDKQLEAEGIVLDAEYNYYDLNGTLVAKQTFSNNRMNMQKRVQLSPEAARAFCIFTCVINRMSTREKIACGFTLVSCYSQNYAACVRGLIRCAVSAALNQPYCSYRCR
ncbi:hypothetical protein GCM10009430_32060 [Aquimarina litoralis]|uniref:Lipoprotein n=1 Tax=Aquimarina litoralis TaxID=584605 RepID=A0ABP3UBL0_9FLAO